MKWDERGLFRRIRLAALTTALLLVFSGLAPGLSPDFLPFSTGCALAEGEDDWEGAPDDWDENWDDFDMETIPFRLVNVEGKEPGIDRESEWKLELKQEWPDQELPERVTAVDMRLYCMNLDWEENWSHVWLKKLSGFPETLPCTGLKVGGRYMLSAIVYYDDDSIEVSAGFEIGGKGKELIDEVINQAAAECKVTGDQWQTALNLYRWLLNRQTYDDTLSYYSSDALLRGAGVCDSYARLYFLLCRAAGLPAYVIYGDTQRGYHAWDAVQIDGEWYYADPTWDDHPVNDPAMDYSQMTPDENGYSYGVSDYRYFMINRELMVINNHTSFEWLDERKWTCLEQPATSLNASYYVRTHRIERWGVADENGFRTIQELIRDTLSAGEKLWSSRSLFEVPVSTRDTFDTPFYLSGNEKYLLSRYLKGTEAELADGTTVKLDTYLYERGDKSGWVLNVYPEGAPATDEAGKYVLPDGLTRIEAQAFEGNPHCGEVICPSGLESIESRAFADCKELWYIWIPSDVKFIAEDAFTGCGEFCIWTEHRESEAARYAEEHDFTLFVQDEEEDSNG